MRQEDFKQAATDYADSPDETQRIIEQVGYEMGCEHGYKYAVNKACELIEKLCDSHNIVSIKDGKYKSRSWLEEQFRKAMEE